MNFFSNHYESWRKSRLDGLLKYIDKSFFKDKTLLELGCGYADIGNVFSNFGCDVSVCDARSEHIEVVKLKYPNLKHFIFDADKDKIIQKYDIILHWGLLYHLTNIEESIHNCSNFSNYLLLETEVSDTDDSTIINYVKENGYDQSYNQEGSRPSPSFVENTLKKYGYKYKMIKDSILNSDFHVYDWEVKNTNKFNNGLRRYWICWKDDCPLKQEFIN